MPRLMIELSQDEWDELVTEAKRERRTAQAQAAELLVKQLYDRVQKRLYAQTLVERALPEAQGPRGGAGNGLPAQEQVGAVEGHRDGAAGGVHEVVVGGAGETQ